MTNIYNFNIPVVTPRKSIREQKLFKKWKHILRRAHISQEIIAEYRKDLLTLKLIVLLLCTSLSFGQSSIVTAGNQTETFGETFPIMQQVDTIVNEVTLGVPKFEVPEQPVVKPKPVKNKTLFEKIIELIKKIFKKK